MPTPRSAGPPSCLTIRKWLSSIDLSSAGTPGGCRMGRYQVHKVLRDINLSPELARRFGEEPAVVLGEYDLTAEEQAALVEERLFDLYQMGVSPVLLVSASMARGKDMLEVAMALSSM